MTKKHQIRVGESDHKTNPKSKGRMLLNANQNKTWDQEFNSTKLLIPADMLDKFKEIYHRVTGKTSNPNENIQRVEITSMEERFNTRKNS